MGSSGPRHVTVATGVGVPFINPCDPHPVTVPTGIY
jgi:hypothetical protein